MQARWEDVSRLVDLALDLEAAARPEFLERTCSADAALRAEVERLVAAAVRAADYLNQPVLNDAAPLMSWVERQESQALAVGTRFGAYEVKGVLGRGGMATVYLAQDHKHHRTVAVKVFDAEVGAAIGREWFLREIDIAAGLQHPHILPLHDSGEIDGRLYYVMPHVEGESLRQRLSREGQIPLASARRIIQEVAGALDYAHRQHVVHRDIKPENILLQEGQAIVADFGIARAIDAGVVDAGATETIPALGTPAYMSPEQATRTARIDGRTDIYAFGCVLYEMLVGAPPFTGATVQAILDQHATAPVPSLRALRPDLPLALEQAVTRALQKAPADRFATAGEFAKALDGVASAAASARPGFRSRRRGLLLGVAVAAVLAAGIGYLMRRPPGAATPNPRLVAILPFRVSGANPELAWLHEGLVDLLAIKLSGEGELRAAEPSAILSAWRRVAGAEGKDIAPVAALEVARRLGAGRVIDGSVVGTPAHLTVTASLLTTPDGRSTAHASVEGPVDSLATLVDRLTARLLSEEAGVHTSQVASLASTSLPATRAYLAGRAAFRKGDWDEAFRQFHQATLLDSTFVLAALEVVHASYYAASGGESREAGRAKRLAQAGRERLGPGDQALLDVWAAPFATAPVLFQRWQTASKEYPDRAEIWYGLGDAYYHDGMFAGLVDPLRLAAGAFQRAWALDSASGTVSVSPEGSPMLTHMVEIAQVDGDTASVRRLVRLRLAADSTSSQGWYLRWHRAVTLGDSMRRVFWADSQAMDPETFTLIYRFTASAGVATQDYQRAANLMIRQWEVGDPDGAAFARHVFALNGGRPREATRVLPAVLSTAGVSFGLPIREALYWGGDTSAAVEAARRLAPHANGAISPGEAGMEQLHSLCALATWRQARGEYHYAEAAVRRLRTAAVAGLPADDSIAVTQYTALCAALLDAVSATELKLPEAAAKLERADSAARSFIVGQSLAANLVIARVAEAQGDLHLALRAVRRRAGRYNMLPTWYLSTFLREEGRLAALTGDTAGAIRAYQHYLALRPDPEPEVKPEVERVGAELAKLMRQRGP